MCTAVKGALKLERDQIVIVECVLKLYPRIYQAMKQREEYLKALLNSPLDRDIVDGGERVPEQELLMSKLESDKDYKLMKGIVEPVKKSVSELPDKERQAVEVIYFLNLPFGAACKKLAYSAAYVQRLKDQLTYSLKDVCMGVYQDVYRWREKDEEERKNVTFS